MSGLRTLKKKGKSVRTKIIETEEPIEPIEESIEKNVDIEDAHEEDEDDPADESTEKRKRKRKRKEKVVTETTEKKETQKPDSISTAFNDDKTLYIEGLPFTATEEDVITFFKSAGTVVAVRLPKWHDSGRLRGYGHVVFPDSLTATRALGLDGGYMKSRYIKVDRPMTPRVVAAAASSSSSSSTASREIVAPPGCRTVFVKNLPYEASEEDISLAFQVCGPVQGVRLPVWGHTQQKKGIGYVDFKREDSALIAVKKSGLLAVQGRPLIVDFETGKPKGSFKPASSSSSPASSASAPAPSDKRSSHKK